LLNVLAGPTRQGDHKHRHDERVVSLSAIRSSVRDIHSPARHPPRRDLNVWWGQVTIKV
jgi:hypothetical protein